MSLYKCAPWTKEVQDTDTRNLRNSELDWWVFTSTSSSIHLSYLFSLPFVLNVQSHLPKLSSPPVIKILCRNCCIIFPRGTKLHSRGILVAKL